MNFIFASTLTLGLLFGMVGTVILALFLIMGADLNIWAILGLTLLFNFIGWLIGPAIQDFFQNWIYKITVIDIESLREKSPKGAAIIEKVCREFSYKIPKIKLIEDNNPTAFCFGSARYNARLVISEGLFEYLKDAEIESVIAHEMGHITRRDFVIMTIASTLIQILYQLYSFAKNASKKKSGSNNKGARALLGAAGVAYAFYFIGQYVVLFLSRAREYGADKFAADRIENPNILSISLIKIAYGILAQPEDEKSQRLMNSTRALGIFDNKSAKGIGSLKKGVDSQKFHQVLLYDKISPWAKILELSSTHPLTGKRIQKLSEYAEKRGLPLIFDLKQAEENANIDHKKLWEGVYTGVGFYFAPIILAIITLILAITTNNIQYILLVPAAIGFGQLARILYKYSKTHAEQITTLDAMSDLYASPVKGKKIVIEGEIIGRGNSGSKFDEDTMIQDSTGLMYMNYESVFGFIGNFFSSFGKIKKLLGQKVSASGWFFRGITHHIDIDEMTPESGNKISSHPMLLGAIGSILLILFSGILFFLFAQELKTSAQSPEYDISLSPLSGLEIQDNNDKNHTLLKKTGVVPEYSLQDLKKNHPEKTQTQKKEGAPQKTSTENTPEKKVSKSIEVSFKYADLFLQNKWEEDYVFEVGIADFNDKKVTGKNFSFIYNAEYIFSPQIIELHASVVETGGKSTYPLFATYWDGKSHTLDFSPESTVISYILPNFLKDRNIKNNPEKIEKLILTIKDTKDFPRLQKEVASQLVQVIQSKKIKYSWNNTSQIEQLKKQILQETRDALEQ